MRQPTRTDLVEEHERKIQSMRFLAMDCTTTARNYGSLAESIEAISPEGPFHVEARADCAGYARLKQEEYATRAKVLKAEADRLEERGFEG